MTPELPGLLAEIAEVAGVPAALAVARAKGGVRAYFPRRPEAGHWLSEAVGEETARAICDRVSGGAGVELLVPMGPDASQAARWRRVRELKKSGVSAAKIARNLRMHLRTVQRHGSERLKPKSLESRLAQRDLFEES